MTETSIVQKRFTWHSAKDEFSVAF